MSGLKKVLKLIVIIIFILYSMLLRGESGGICIGGKIKIFSKNLNKNIPVLISLPAGYEDGNKKYPVIFKFNGDIKNTFLFAASSLKTMAGNYSIPEIILVDIAFTGQNSSFLLQKKDKTFRVEPEKFALFITDELIAYIDRNYRTIPYRILYGQSNAGMFTIYMMFEHGVKFNAFIATSPMIGWHTDYFYKKAVEQPIDPGRELKHLAIVFGEKDLNQVTGSIPGFNKILGTRKDLILEANRISGCGHVPYTAFYKGLRSVFRGWKYTGDLTEGEDLEKIKIHYSDLEKRFGLKIDPPYYLLFKLGFNLFRKTILDESEKVFSHIVELYPDSYQSRLMLARLFQSLRKKEKALDQINILLEKKPGYSPALRLKKRLVKK